MILQIGLMQIVFQPNGNQNTRGNAFNIGVDPIEHKLNCKFLGIFIDNQVTSLRNGLDLY